LKNTEDATYMAV